MKRIIMHWTGGAYQPSAYDKKYYHKLIDGNGKVHDGKYPIAANETINGGYAAHTRNCNTGSIGIAVCAMFGAKESPFDVGNYPITDKQFNALCAEVARLCVEYGIDVTAKTVLTHAEVQDTLGIKQRNKWDITAIGGNKWDATHAGLWIRMQVLKQVDDLKPKQGNGFALLISKLFSWIFKGAKK